MSTVLVDFLKSQPERLDQGTLRLESAKGNLVTFAVDGYAADHEASHVFTAVVRCTYDVTTQAVTRLEL